jgi:predicted transcriptional regulator
MPLISSRPNRPKRKFVKKEYRPWTILEDIDPEETASKQVSANSNVPHEIISGPINNKETPANIDEISNRQQTGNKEITNGKQTESKEITNGKQRDNKRATKRVTERVTNKQVTNGEQTGNKIILAPTIYSLIGNEKNIVEYLFNLCYKTGSLTTPNITIDNMSQDTGISSKSIVKTVIYRLVKKGIIERHGAKTGRGGWMCFKINEKTYQELITKTDVKQVTNGEQTGNKRDTKQVTERVTNAPSSSSYINNIYKNTTTKDNEEQQNIFGLPPEWMDIDISPLESIRFTQEQLRHIYRKKQISREIVQDSIYAYAFDLKENNKGKNLASPLNFFMGILVKQGIPYAPPENYESPRDRGLRLYIERKRVATEKKKELEEEAISYAYTDWVTALTEPEKAKILPEYYKKNKVTGSLNEKIINSELKNYFIENIWQGVSEKL